MALNSPGVEVTIIDQSQYLPAAPASVPFVMVATAQNKATPAGTDVAVGTTAANAGKLYRVTSQRDLVTLFGNPFFYKTTNGTPLQGYELNEYGLLTAYSVLGSSNLCYVMRADVDLAALVGRTGRPSSPPADGTYWLNTTASTWGIYEFNEQTGKFTNKIPLVLNDSADLVGGATGNGQPLDSIGNIGDYAITFRTDANGRTQAASPSSYDTYWFKTQENTWVALGGATWRLNWATAQGEDVPPASITGTIIINGVSVVVPAAPNDNLAGLVGEINSAQIPWITADIVDGRIALYSEIGQTLVISTTPPPPPPAPQETLLDYLGLQSGTYYTPQLFYGTNAQQPRWRSTDPQPHPTGSVWIKTNAANLGTNLVFSQYSAATGTFTNVAAPLYDGDWAATATLDSTGGANIPVGTVYAQYGSGATESTISPLQLWRRSATGPAVFVGSPTTTFTASAQITVLVSQPGTVTADGPYTVTLPASGTGTGGDVVAVDFVTAWLAANIPYVTAEVTSTANIVLTHTLGGHIDISNVDPAVDVIGQAGFTIGVTPGAKWGYAISRNYADLATTAVSGTGLDATLDLTTRDYSVTAATVNAGGSGYVVGDVLRVTEGNPLDSVNGYTFRVTAVDGTNAITSVEWLSGFATPVYALQLSNWYNLNYIPNPIQPVVAPADGTPWYFSVINQVDIMTNDGGVWRGYKNVGYGADGLPSVLTTNSTDPNGPIIASVAPTTQSDGTPLAYGDLWIDSNDLDNYPVISRWQNLNGVDEWVTIDNTDQLTENGIVFADARWATDGTVDPVFDPVPSIQSLLTSNYLDLDAVSAQNYPSGTLLFNTRRSGYNVKEFRSNYFSAANFPDTVLPQETSAWVTSSGNQTNGAPYMGRKAQRIMIVRAMKSAINTSSELREEDTFFNLMAAPNYPELQPDMIVLNNDRGQTAYIIGDTPLRLADDANDIVAWATNAAGAGSTGDSGLVSRDTYMGLYYPGACLTTDLSGTEVVAPVSHMILRTMIYNDTVAYPWFAPAGQRRGIIDNATSIGYIDADSGEYVTTKNRVQLRDVEYTNFINPVAFFTNLGLLNYGNKNSFDSQSALDRTNVARLVAYLRWNLQIALRPFIFEPNDSVTRSQAKSVVQTLLADIQSKRGIYDYLVVCDESNNTPARIDRNELWVDVAIEPTKAAEFIYVPVRILNTGEIAGLGQNG